MNGATRVRVAAALVQPATCYRVASSALATVLALGGWLAVASQARAQDDNLEVDVTTTVVDANGDSVGEVPESIGDLTVLVTATTNGNSAPADAVSFWVTALDGTALGTEDFVHLSVFPVFSPAEWVLVEADGNYRAQRRYVLSIVDDPDEEPDRETVQVVTRATTDTADYVTLPGWVELAIVDDDSVPGPPTNLEATAAGATAIGLSWAAPSDTGSSPLDGYQIERSADGDTRWRFLVSDTNSTATTYTDSGLSAETTRYYRVSAASAAGVGEPSVPASATTDPPPPVITVEAESTPVTEGEEALFVVTRAGPVEEGLEVLAELSTTGSLAFSGGPKTLTLRMEPESRLHSFGLLTTADDRDEADGNVTLTVMAPEDGSYEVGSPSSAMVVVEDDDDLEVQVTTAVVDANGLAVTEVPEHIGAATIRLTATTNGSLAPTEAFAVAVSTRGDSAVSPDDYGALSVEVPFGVADWVFVDADDHYSAVQDVLLAIVDDSLDEEDRETFGLLTERAAGIPANVSFPGWIELAIVDNDEPTYALSVDPTSIAEAGGVATVEVSTGGVTLATDQEFELTLGGTATLDTDYTIDATTLTLDAGETEVTATITAFDDTEDDDAETVVVTASLDGTTVGSAQTITIDDDDDGLPEVELSRWTPEVIEGEVTTFTLVRSGPVTDALTVSVEVSETGSMISGQAPTSVVFPAGADFKTLNVSTVDDDVDEPDSVITATITAGEDPPYALGTDVSLESIVTDNDDLEVDVTTAVVDADGSAVMEVSEGIGAATIRVTASTGGSLPPTSDFDVSVSTRADSAVSPDDYAALSLQVGYQVSDWVLVDAEGTYRAVQDVSLAIVDDTLEEPERETLGLVTERAPGTPAYVSFPPRLELAIVDNDSAPVEPPDPVLPEVTIAARSTPVDEGSDAMFVLTRTGATTEALPVSVDVTETGSMISGTAPVSAVFDAEQATTVLAVPTVDDSLDEADSGVVATVTAGEGDAHEVGSDSSATVIVRDNDSVPGEPTNLVATAAGQAAIDLTWAEPGDTGTSAIAGYRIERSADGTSGWTELVGDTGSSATEYRDNALEPGATHYYRVFAMNFAGTGPPSNVASALTSSDPPEPEPPDPPDPPEVTIKPATSPVDEGTEVMFFLSRTGGAAEALTVSVEVAETGSMISEMAPTTAVFAVGAEETTFTVPTADDVVDEPASVITATVTAGEDAAYSVGTASSAAVTVNDNDAVPGAPDSLAATADGEAAIDLRWAPPSDPGSSAITGYRVEWSTDGSSGWKELVADSGSTATAYRDNGLEPGTTRSYRVCAMNSTGPGPVSNVAGATTSLPLPEVTITAAESAVDEGAAVTFVLSRTGAAAELLAVSLEATETGSTIGGAPPASAVFSAGAAETTLSIVTEDDSLDEPDREITVTLRDGDGYTLGSDISATVQVKDNDATPVLAITDASAPEGAGEIVFTVTLSGESAMPATVRWASSAATARPGLDYIEASGELTFAPGTTSRRLAVPLLEDLLVEDAETFRVSLSEATNAAFEAGSVMAATGTIEDDDDTAPAEEWLARFGRTAASNAVDAVEDRLTGRLGTGSQVVVAGHRIDVSAPGQDHGATGSGQGNGAAASAAAPVTGLGGIGQAAGGAGGLAVSGGGLLDAQPGRYGSGRTDAGDLRIDDPERGRPGVH